jgi:hypothetical protein
LEGLGLGQWSEGCLLCLGRRSTHARHG